MGACFLPKVILSIGSPHWPSPGDGVASVGPTVGAAVGAAVGAGVGSSVVTVGAAVGLTEQYQLSK